MKARYLVAAFFLALPGSPLLGQSVKAGIEAWQKSDYSAAVGIWRPLADRGDADAQFNLGQAYRLGRGVPINLALAKNWFTKAAEAGHLDAETTLGLLLFQNGDQAGGLKWLRRAADQNEPRAMLVYGTALYNGDGVPQDRLLGYALIDRAANLGLAPAKETLSQLDDLMSDSDRKKALILAKAREPYTPPVAAKTPSAPILRPPSLARVAQARPAVTKPQVARTAVVQQPTSSPPRGDWRIQLGAFSQRASAKALYRRLAGRGALSGRGPIYVPAGSVTRLQVGPFASKAAAAAACSALGQACFPVPAR